MRNEGYALLVLLIMLIFAAMVLLQLREDNYLSQLVLRHVTSLFEARSALFQALTSLSKSSNKKLSCYIESNDPLELDKFWTSHLGWCRMTVAGLTLDYAYREYEEAGQQSRYVQYSLRINSHFSDIWLRAVEEASSHHIVSWQYFSP